MIAVVDIGSNSVKVLVAKMQHEVMEEIHLDAETTSLARNLSQTGQLSEEAMRATVAALERFQSKILELKVDEVKVVGTAAMREAANASELVARIGKIFPSPVEIITGLEEATLALRGAMTARPEHVPETDCLFADLGGASTEIGFSQPTKLLVSTSLGALKSHNALGLGGEAIGDLPWQAAQDYVWQVLEREITPELQRESRKKKHFIAVGGTIVMATQALGLTAFRGACYAFRRSDLEDFADKLRKIGEIERSQIPKLRRDRADILPFGIMVLTQIMKYLGQENGISTVRGLRHGLAQQLLEKRP